MTERDIALKELRKIGFENAAFSIEWEGARVYEPVGADGSGLDIGYPLYCLVKNGRGRIATRPEMLKIMKVLAAAFDAEEGAGDGMQG